METSFAKLFTLVSIDNGTLTVFRTGITYITMYGAGQAVVLHAGVF